MDSIACFLGLVFLVIFALIALPILIIFAKLVGLAIIGGVVEEFEIPNWKQNDHTSDDRKPDQLRKDDQNRKGDQRKNHQKYETEETRDRIHRRYLHDFGYANRGKLVAYFDVSPIFAQDRHNSARRAMRICNF